MLRLADRFVQVSVASSAEVLSAVVAAEQRHVGVVLIAANRHSQSEQRDKFNRYKRLQQSSVTRSEPARSGNGSMIEIRGHHEQDHQLKGSRRKAGSKFPSKN